MNINDLKSLIFKASNATKSSDSAYAESLQKEIDTVCSGIKTLYGKNIDDLPGNKVLSNEAMVLYQNLELCL